MHKVQALTRLYAVVGNQPQCAAACLLVPYIIHAVHAPMRKNTFTSIGVGWGHGRGHSWPPPLPFFLLSYRAIKRRKFQSAWKAILLRVFYRMRSWSLNENGTALGAQAGEERIAEIVKSVGFSRFRRATQTSFNLVFEARLWAILVVK